VYLAYPPVMASRRNSPVTSRVSEEAEEAVRRYLDFLDNPQSRPTPEEVVDVAAIRSSADNSLDAVKQLSKALEAAAETEDPEAAFVRYAKAWAEHNGVSREAFKAFGVKPSVLTRAFGDAKTTKSPRGATTRARVDTEALLAGIRNKPAGTLVTVLGVTEEFGGSRATVRTMLDRLTREGVLINLGPDPAHRGPGRASVHFERA